MMRLTMIRLKLKSTAKAYKALAEAAQEITAPVHSQERFYGDVIASSLEALNKPRPKRSRSLAEKSLEAEQAELEAEQTAAAPLDDKGRILTGTT